MKYFRDEYIEHIQKKRCQALHCRELIRFRVIEEACTGYTAEEAMAEAARRSEGAGARDRQIGRLVPGCSASEAGVIGLTKSLATELADYLVGKGMPFREAHHLVGKIVQHHPRGHQFKRGEEKGYFEFGGSTLIQLFMPKYRGKIKS